MRKVKYFVANSLDNFITGADGSIDWLLMDGDYGMKEFFASIDTVLMGRKTYEFALSQSAGYKRKSRAKKTSTKRSSKSSMRTYVFSRTIKDSMNEEVNIISENAVEFVRQLKAEAGKDIWLMGGGLLAGSLLAENVVDEISLAVHPVLLSSGAPLFYEIGQRIELELISCKAHPNGVVQLAYSVKH